MWYQRTVRWDGEISIVGDEGPRGDTGPEQADPKGEPGRLICNLFSDTFQRYENNNALRFGTGSGAANKFF